MRLSSGLRVSIVGFGPRGLGALEALTRAARDTGVPVAVDIFEPGKWPAAGPNFSPDESEVCLLNLPLRDIDLPPAVADGIGDFGAWLGESGRDEEAYLPRAWLGEYLHARFRALVSRLPENIECQLHRLRVQTARRDRDGWTLYAEGEAHGGYHHVLLALGQPQTRPDKQLERWQDHADAHDLPLFPAYPGAALVAAADEWAGRNVGIRGLALSALDVVRLLTVGIGGRFEGGRYVPSGREPSRIVPFSLDGHAPAPKPASALLDKQFDPLPDEYSALEESLHESLQNGTDDLGSICRALGAAAVRVLRDHGSESREDAVDHWLRTEVKSPGAQKERDTTAALTANIAQAEGTAPPEIGYVVGQVWRKFQPHLRSIYDALPVAAATAKALTNFDEGLKRYSYGGPPRATRQLLALIECGLVEPRAADDPDIRLMSDGWQIRSGGQIETVGVMIDSVLPPPVLEQVNEPLIQGIRHSSILQPLDEELGARCGVDASVISHKMKTGSALSLIGRLANGSVIAADSIHDCFCETNDRWARALVGATISSNTGI